MATEIRVPTLGESVAEATVGKWLKKPGEAVKADEPLVELETDKVSVEVPAPSAGTLTEILVQEGETVEVGAILAQFGEGGAAAFEASAPAKAAEKAVAPAAPAASSAAMPAAPAAQKMMAEKNIDPASVQGSGKRGQVLKEDVLRAPAPVSVPAAARVPSGEADSVREERVKMTRLRQTIARRLKDAQNTAAMLTTFNEVDMSAVMDLRNRYKDLFEKKHGVKLGFMGFFTKAVCHALKEIPAVNAEIDGTDLIYKNYCHIGVAVGTEKGLVVPVVRDADQMSIAGIEQEIGNLGRKARDGELSMADMQGGTFTISNGGVYGSLMS
ncbi:MAG: 2-oxoglutarate dehydrogenase complex dihydrolipoyllysine-residue succinyltransferase, partial [Nitratireductor sp.]|nr:2-oxoglutarate dehydrogenase complex dihydrolipoyllysine-residue succinyltransferase [Nitratireductor sp.]